MCTQHTFMHTLNGSTQNWPVKRQTGSKNLMGFLTVPPMQWLTGICPCMPVDQYATVYLYIIIFLHEPDIACQHLCQSLICINA